MQYVFDKICVTVQEYYGGAKSSEQRFNVGQDR